MINNRTRCHFHIVLLAGSLIIGKIHGLTNKGLGRSRNEKSADTQLRLVLTYNILRFHCQFIRDSEEILRESYTATCLVFYL